MKRVCVLNSLSLSFFHLGVSAKAPARSRLGGKAPYKHSLLVQACMDEICQATKVGWGTCRQACVILASWSQEEGDV